VLVPVLARLLMLVLARVRALMSMPLLVLVLGLLQRL